MATKFFSCHLRLRLILLTFYRPSMFLNHLQNAKCSVGFKNCKDLNSLFTIYSIMIRVSRVAISEIP